MDVHVRLAVTRGLRRRQVDVLRAQEDGTRQWSDSQLLDRATTLDRVLFTQDKDFLRETARRQQTGEPFAGVIYAEQRKVSVSRCIDDLEIIAKLSDSQELANRLIYLPF
jgi:predicted nuclease of predicted toxin-antitoxin system